MNKLFTKIASIALGLSMAAGVGVAVSDNKAVLTAQAADTFEKVTSFAVGDQIIFVNESKKYEMSSGAGSNATSYTTSPAGTYVMTVEAGNDGTGYSFKNGSNYISWTSGNNLATSATKNNASSWTISTSDSGNFKLANVGTTDRILQFNSGSPKFAPYTSTQTAFQIYKKVSAKTVTGITKTTSPTKTAYLSGESFDPTGLVISVSYSNGSPDTVAYVGNESDFSWTPTTITAAGNVQIQYKTYSSYKVTQAVTIATVTSVNSVASSPVSVEKNGTVSPSEVTLNVGLSSGGTTVVNATSIDLDTSVAGNNIQGKAYYNDVGSATFTIAVIEGYELVTDASKLTAGTTFVLAHESTNTIGIGAWSSSYFTTTTISISGTKISTTTSAMVFTLEGSSGAWKVKSGDYYYGLQNSTTALRDQTGSGNNYSWTISITNNIATMKTAGSGTRSLCYNGSANPVRYSAYTASSTYTQVRIYAIIPAASCTVTYNNNGATSGSVPTDSNKYNIGDNVTILGNTGSLAKTDFTWVGWNTNNNGTGTHYNANDTFEIEGSTTLYAEWAKTLDAITSITGSVTGSFSKAGTYNWDFSGLTATGTISGSTGQNVTEYVDFSSSTPIPSTIGSCTVSVTATKKSTTAGSASSLTVNNISGEVEPAKLVYSFTMTQADLLQTGISYANENGHQKISTATCAGHEPIQIEWATNQVMKNNSDMQFQTTNGYLYNVTEIPGTITDVTVTATAQSFNVYYDNSEHPTSGTTPGGKYFTVQGSGSTPKASQIVVTFEVSDKPRVQLVASDINLDVADGAATPTVTDGTSPVTGYSMNSIDPYVASITNDGKVQPVGYGKVRIEVTKDEDAGHIYLATTFLVTVGDHSKETSIMEFTAKASDDVANRTADDGVVWSIDCNRDENDFSEVYGINYGTGGNTVTSLVFTTPADDNRIIKNVVVEAMSASGNTTITVSVGSTPFTCSKENTVTSSVSTFNFSGNTSGAITITISGTASSKYGVKSIAVLYVGDEATSFASTFLGAIACNSQGTSKPTFTIKEGSTYWSWTLLASEYNSLSATDKAKFAKGATGISSTIIECVERYDYIVGKYYVGGLDRTLISSDFMQRNPSPVGTGGAPLLLAANIKNTNTIAIIVIISMVSVTAIGGYFFLRKRKEQ